MFCIRRMAWVCLHFLFRFFFYLCILSSDASSFCNNNTIRVCCLHHEFNEIETYVHLIKSVLDFNQFKRHREKETILPYSPNSSSKLNKTQNEISNDYIWTIKSALSEYVLFFWIRLFLLCIYLYLLLLLLTSSLTDDSLSRYVVCAYVCNVYMYSEPPLKS